MSKKTVTLNDIANKAGVSITTVSHVINKTRYVKKETREYVLRVIDDLEYFKNKPKSNAKKIAFIGVIVADITEDYFISVIKAIETYATNSGISILVCDSENDIEKEQKNINMMLDRNISGLILAPVNSEKCPKEITESSIPVILLDRQYRSHNKIFVGINNFESGYDAARYLSEHDCSNIGFIGYSDMIYTARQRSMGYRSYLLETRKDASPKVLTINYNREDSNKLIREFIEESNVDGLICTTSDICYQVLGSCEELGIQIPEQIKIITYDDNKWLDYLKYPVTVINQPTVEIGIHAIEMLIRLIEAPWEDKGLATEIFLKISFIDRL